MSVSKIVFDQIVAQLRDGRLRPGERLPTEMELVGQFKVARSSVREALKGLATLGLIESRPGRGAIVARQAESPLAKIRRGIDLDHLNRRALLDLLEVREALESKAAMFAAQRATSDDIKELRRIHKALERDVAAGRSYFNANTAFHRAIAAAAHNPVLAETIRLLIGQVRSYRERLMSEITSMPEQDVKEHGDLLEAIAAGKSDLAGKLMARHIRSFASLLSAESPRHAA
ncbi:MAG: FadR/GntR family transcriptional regulator [Hyphomicrobiaceae bacterium]